MAETPFVKVAVRVNGVKLFFLLDTGAEISVIDAKEADRIGVVSAGMARVIGLDRMEAEIAIIDQLEFGKRTIKGLRVVKDKSGNTAFDGFHGILGLDVLKDYRLTIDFKNRQVVAERI